SSSTTTSITVGFVAGGVLTLQGAIPIIMGANIGTTVTNTIVSIGHVTRRHEFRRAFAGATVHDFFNILAVLVLFPLEITTHVLQKAASLLSGAFVGVGGIKYLSPLKAITKPVLELVMDVIPIPVVTLILAVLLMFFSLLQIVRTMRSLMLGTFEVFLDRYLFKNDGTSFLLGILFTMAVQSSSITTSLIIPLVGAGLLSVRKIFPYTLGANIGTTITAILAAFATLNPIAITVAFTHLLFNIFGICIFYPLKKIPLWMAETFAGLTARSKKHIFIFILCYFSFLILVPLILVLLME
ncbi:MAG: Na/Pi symporter, partial [Candidatus Aminicenantales bacterium]